MEAKKQNNSWQERDTVSYIFNYSNSLYSHLQYPFTSNHAFLDLAATDSYANNNTPLL